mmetsp:Transcript_129988/g.337069  ORF Transcript_129988/g.337069 Transcript_129988/m.337069 type:complete len:463 (+) Transcript_129988:1534-2922(+)
MTDNLLTLLINGVDVRWALEGCHGVLQIDGFGVEPIGGLPTVGETELRSSGFEHGDDVVLWAVRMHYGPCTRPILIEVSDVIVPTIGLLHLVTHPSRGGPSTVASRIRLGELVRRLTMLHPMDEVSTEASPMSDAIGLGTCIPIVWLLMRGADKVITVCGPASGPVQHCLDTCGLELRHQLRRFLHAVHNALQVTLEQMVCELWRHGALPLRGGQLHVLLALIRPYENSIPLIAEVVGPLKVPQDGKLVPMLLMVGLDFWDRLRDHVLVLQHRARRVHSGEVTNALGPQSSAIDHTSSAYNMGLAPRRLDGDLPRAVGHALHADHLRILEDPATQGPRLRGKGLRHGRGIDVAVAFSVQGANEAVGVDERVQALDLLRSDHVHLVAIEKALVELGLRERVVSLLHPFLTLEKPHGTWLVEGEWDAILVLPLLEQSYAFIVPELEIVAAVVVRDKARGMPSGS